jgi:hypothetical protein
MDRGEIGLEGKNNKMAWVEYQIALDYFAMERVEGQADFEKQHKQHMKKALSLDPDKAVHPIYADQLLILDRLLPK